MRNLIVIIFAIISCLSSYGQGKECDIPMYKAGDTSLWYIWKQRDSRQAGLPDLTRSKDSLHIRFSTENQSIDIWTNDHQTFYGTFMNHTTSEPCDDCLIKGKSKFYSHKHDLDTAKTRMVYDLFDKLSIFNIPTMDSIKGWDQGNDGEEFLIEHSTPIHYSFKEYWSPDGFKETIKEAAAIDTLAHQLKAKFEMEESFHAFIHLLPPGCYHYVSYFVTCHDTWPDFIMW